MEEKINKNNSFSKLNPLMKASIIIIAASGFLCAFGIVYALVTWPR